MSRLLQAKISTLALQHNLRQAQKFAPHAKIAAVIKANAYGHGLLRVADALASLDETAMFAVGCADEAIQLREAKIDKPILLLEGFEGHAELDAVVEFGLQTVIHSEEQLALLTQTNLKNPLVVWLKVDTGMHRLGFLPQRAQEIYSKLNAHPNVKKIVWISHFANADEPDHALNAVQKSQFEHCFQHISGASNFANFPKAKQEERKVQIERSFCNSAGVLAHPAHHHEFVRPGIMLYGASPFSGKTGADHDLKPVMTVQAPIIAIKQLEVGDCIGYGSNWCAQRPTRMGVVAIGYGHGYPRHAQSGTPVLVNGQQVSLIGRVSMDMLTVDLTDLYDTSSTPNNLPKVGDLAALWGEGLPAELVATDANTIAYELFCRMTSRVCF